MTSTDSQPLDFAELDTNRLTERNLERALLDFELANARVLDLTQRLVALTSELAATREQLETTRMRISHLEADISQLTGGQAALEAENTTIKSSLAYRTFRILGDTRARLRR